MGVYWTRRSDPGRAANGAMAGRRTDRLVLRRTGPRSGSDSQLYSVSVYAEPDWDRVAALCRDDAELASARERYALRAAAERLERDRARVSLLAFYAADLAAGTDLLDRLPESEREEARRRLHQAVREAAIAWKVLRPRPSPKEKPSPRRPGRTRPEDTTPRAAKKDPVPPPAAPKPARRPSGRTPPR